MFESVLQKQQMILLIIIQLLHMDVLPLVKNELEVELHGWLLFPSREQAFFHLILSLQELLYWLIQYLF